MKKGGRFSGVDTLLSRYLTALVFFDYCPSGFPLVFGEFFMNVSYFAIYRCWFFQGKTSRPPRTLHFGSLGGSGFEPRCPGSAEECGVGNHFKRHRGAQRLVDGGHWSNWSLVIF